MKLNKFLPGDKVKLLDGRTGTVQTKYSKNSNQYLVETYTDDMAEKTFFTIFANDMELITTEPKLTATARCRLTEAEKDAFNAKCKENGTTESEAIRELIRLYLIK